jgi:hypothetical protein
VTGSGRITTTCGQASFFIDVRRKRSGALGGRLQYEDPDAGVRLHSTAITFLTVDGDTAEFGGPCLEQGTPCTFTVQVVGNGPPDSFRITAAGASLPPGYDEGGQLTSGRIRVTSG